MRSLKLLAFGYKVNFHIVHVKYAFCTSHLFQIFRTAQMWRLIDMLNLQTPLAIVSRSLVLGSLRRQTAKTPLTHDTRTTPTD